MSLQSKTLNLPDKPGVYFFKRLDEIIYIGKAKSLKKRVSSYFSSSSRKNPKTNIIVSKSTDIEWLVVNNEMQALITEANMIKEYHPRYNVFLKDDKSFPYIAISSEPYPKVEIVREKKMEKNSNIYFGPYTDVTYLRNLMKFIHKAFPVRTCSYYIDEESIDQKKVSVCLDFHIGKCKGPCEGLIPEYEYNDYIKQIIGLLKGNDKQIVSEIKSKMKIASDNLQFEIAAGYRDQLAIVEKFVNVRSRKVRNFSDQDVICIADLGKNGIGLIMKIRNGKLIGREKFNLNISKVFSKNERMYEFLFGYYSSTSDFPKEIIIEESIKEEGSFKDWLLHVSRKSIKVVNPKKGDKKFFLDLCKKNADLLIKEYALNKQRRGEASSKSVVQLGVDLGLSIDPKRIHAFDNSNIFGSHAVSGMVCFIDGKPSKSEYRKFKIKTVKGIDDFASMREVVSRCYKRVIEEKRSLPDLIVIDGGKGQLSSAKSSLDNLGLGYIPVVGLAKRLEEVYIPQSDKPQNISKSSPGLFLLRKVRDEVHRFSILYHRELRVKSTKKSLFLEIKGVGEKTIKKIWKKYSSIKEISQIDPNKISKDIGVSIVVSRLIVDRAKNFLLN